MASWINKPMGASGQKTKNLTMMCIGGYCLLTGGKALLEEYIPEPGRIHAMQLETGASAFVTLPDKCVCVWGYIHSCNAP